MARRPEFLLSGASTAFHETKRSRFEAFAEPFRSPQDFDALYERLRDPKATHSAWAWRIGEQSRCCDDGELSGTAGRSILVAIDGALLDQVLVV
ncbi:MAG: YigZ family protein, partial [Myxococcota bacterium]|nr:YigZ family protein [Myxococcota bacterium]